MKDTVTATINPQTLADDLAEIRQIYSQFFTALKESDWDKPVKGGPKEWTLHETIAHLVALSGAGLDSVKHTLRGEPYIFVGLETRYQLNAFNRKGIDDRLDVPMKELCGQFLTILDEAGNIARMLQPDQTELTAYMSIYNRPVTILEALTIITIHAGVFHSAQVAEPAGLPPLWMQLSPEIRHRMFGGTMLAFSLLYRGDIGGSLNATIAYRIDGPGGGEWQVVVSPQRSTSSEGIANRPDIEIHLRGTNVACQLLTDRLNLPLALVRGDVKLSGDLRLFLRMNTLFSVDARP